MYGCESWTTKKAEHWRIDAFELWCWRRLLRVLWTARKSNQSILKEISPEYSLEGLMLELKLQYLGHMMRKIDSLEKTLMLGGIGGRRRRGRQRMRWHHWLDGHEFEQALGVGEGQGSLVCCVPWGRIERDTAEWLNWPTVLINIGTVFRVTLRGTYLHNGKLISMELHLRTSLVVQCSGFHIFTVGGLGSIPVLGTRILHATWHSLKKKEGRKKKRKHELHLSISPCSQSLATTILLSTSTSQHHFQ